MTEKSGTDARFPYEARRIVVSWLIVFLLREQEVAGSNPVAPTVESAPCSYGGLFVAARNSPYISIRNESER